MGNCVVSKIVKHGGGSLMVWDCMSWEGIGIGKLNKVEEIIDSKHYHNIL